MKTKLKILLIAVLSVFLAFSFVACGGNKPEPSPSASVEPSVTAAPSTDPGTNPSANPSVEPTTKPTPTPAPDLKPEAGKYTLNQTFSLSPKTWSPLTWEDNSDSIILGYTTMGLYDVQLNAAKNGYEWVCEMAAAFPEDVTANYVGKYGVKAGESGKVWKIALNRNAKWQNGDAITADDYMYSMQQMLDPAALNRRSDSYTSGNFAIYGASTYLYSKTATIYSAVSKYYETVAAALAAGDTVYVDVWSFYGAQGYVDAQGNACPQYVSITDETVYDIPAAWEEGFTGKKDTFTTKAIYETYYGSHMDEGHYMYVARENTNLDDNFDHVGIEKTGDYEITIALEASLDDFNVKYNLSSTWLVHRATYEATKVTTAGGIVSSTYGTSLDKYMAFGPYKLTAYSLDSYFTLEKNDAWYGYTDGKHEGQFQTNRIYYRYMIEQPTILEAFLLGKVDDVSLTGDNMAKYGNSKYLVATPESYTYQFFLCTNLNKLQGRDTDTENHSILSLQSFRKAFSYAINRSQYCAQFDPASSAGFGLLNYLYVIDPDTGAVYRETVDAKRASLRLNDFVEQGDGSWKDHAGTVYPTLDEAYEAITGYDPAYAKELFQQAYDEAVAKGLLKAGQKVVIDRGAVAENENGRNMLALFNGFLAEATKGTSLEGKVSLKYNTKYSTNETFWAAVKAGDLDLAFAAWGGSAMDPWGIVYSCYLDTANCFSPLFRAEADKMDITIKIGEENVTAKLTDWAKWLANYQKADEYISVNLFEKLGALGDAELSLKTKILAEIEYAELATYNNLPIFYSVENGLQSAKVKNGSDTYLGPMIGFGGIRHITFNYDDVAWAAYVAQQGGNLDSLYAG